MVHVHSCRQDKLICHLKFTGRYYAFKKHLKTAVLNLIRQKFLSEASVQDPEQMEVWSVCENMTSSMWLSSFVLQKFLSQLYVYLVEEMHCGLKQGSSTSGTISKQHSMPEYEKIKHYAEEAVVYTFCSCIYFQCTYWLFGSFETCFGCARYVLCSSWKAWLVKYTIPVQLL